MPWSRTRATFLERLAPALRGRLDVHCTAYGVSQWDWYPRGRAWLSIDGEEFVTVDSTLPGFSRAQFRCCSHPIQGDGITAAVVALLDMPIQVALASPDTTIRALALCDSRTGRRTLERLRCSPRHPLETALLEVREFCIDGVPLPDACHACNRPRRDGARWASRWGNP